MSHTPMKLTSFLSGIVLLLVLGSPTDAWATIIVSGTGRAAVGSLFLPNKLDYYASRMGAQGNAYANLYAAAKKACPGGYTIVAGPYDATTTSLVWTGVWAVYESFCGCYMEIDCDSTNKGDFPVPPMKDAKPLPSSKDGEKLYRQQLQELSRIKTGQELLRYVESHKIEGVDYSPFHEAVKAGEVKHIVIPPLDQFLKVYTDILPSTVIENGRSR